MDLSQNTALVTGASGGIGEQIARQLAARGVSLVLTARSEEKLEGLAEQLRSSRPGLQVTVLAADLSDPGTPNRLVSELKTRNLMVDILVNNAGVGSHGLFAAEDPTAVARQIQLNCGSLVALTSLLLPDMLARGRGGVLNVASTSAFQPTPTMAVYGATKAFVLSFTEALWVETRKSGVRVMALCPGPTETDFFGRTGKEFLTRGRQTPEQVAAVALRAFESGRGPSAISGLANRLGATSYRFFPRKVMVRMAGSRVGGSG